MKKLFIIVPILVVLLVAANTLFIMDETEQGIILQFGRFVRTVQAPGLHLKTPFLQDVTKYDKRLLRYDAPPAEFLTRDKKALVVDSYARFRIVKPLQFFQTMRDIPRAHARLDAIIASALREAVATHDQSEIITEKREPIMAEVATSVREKASAFGVEIVDVRIKRTDFPREIAESIHSRMQAERGRISKRFRSEGAEEQLKIKGETDKEQAIILADAKRQSEELRGKGDGEAIRIFAAALKQDPEFYVFLKSLELYKSSLTEDTSLVLSAESDLFRYLEKPGKAR